MMYAIFQSTIIIQVFHYGMFQMMPMQFPGMPVQGLSVPGSASPGMPPGMTPGMPGIQMPIAMPITMQAAPKLPIVVMPFYSKNAKGKPNKRRPKKKRYKKRFPASSSESCSSDSSDVDFRSSKKGRSGRRRQVLTPVVSYVTKEGYVVYQKKIRKERAKDWLRMGKDKSLEVVDDHERAHKRRSTKKRRSH